jgi:hypothetical protein
VAAKALTGIRRRALVNLLNQLLAADQAEEAQDMAIALEPDQAAQE